MELRDYLRLARKYWVQLLVVTLLGAAAAAGVTAATPKVYIAEAQLFVSANSTTVDLSSTVTGANFSAQRIKTYSMLVTTPQVLEPVSAKLGYEVPANALQASNPLDTVLLVISASDSSAQHSADIANAVSLRLASNALVV